MPMAPQPAPAAPVSSYSAGGAGEASPFDFQIDEAPPPRRGGAVIIGVVVVLLLLVGIGFGIRALLSNVTQTDDEGAGAGATSAAPTPTAVQTPTQAASPQPTATTPTAVPGAAPRIAGITSIDLSDTADSPAGVHEEAVGRAIDGDPATYWFSQTYTRDDFSGFKDGVGLALTLDEPATVSTVTLHVNGTGGNVQVRATDAANPTSGAVLASGPMSADTVLQLDPATVTDSLVIWFTQLPTNAAGQFRIELTEITLR